MRYPESFIDRYFWPSIGILFLALFVPLMFREWLSLKTEGMYNVEWHTTSMANLLQRDLEARQPLPEVLANLDDPLIFDEFDYFVRQKIGHLGLLNVRIYTASGEIVYALEKELIGKVFLPGEGRKSALRGKVASELISSDKYFQEYSYDAKTDMAEVYVPITLEKDGSIPYILEAYYDYTPIMSRTKEQLGKSALSLLATLLIILVLLGYLYRGRQKMGRQIKALEAILPICMHCKKIHLTGEDQPEEWMDIESYFAKQDDLAFSHGICNDCLQKHYPETKVAQKNARGESS